MTRAQLIRQIQLAIIGLTRIPPTIVEALSFLLAGAGESEDIAWLSSLLTCVTFLGTGNEVAAGECFSKLYFEAKLESTARTLLNRVVNTIESIFGGGNTVAISAVAPIPVVPGTCSTKSGTRGICCAAVTQLGLTRAAQGFQYTNCNGRVVCLACGTKRSVSKKNPGATVFSVKRVSCGVSGCPALSAIQGQIIAAQ